jgi:hypothetical protein
MITRWMASFILFLASMMMLGGLGLMIDAGIHVFGASRVVGRPGQR